MRLHSARAGRIFLATLTGLAIAATTAGLASAADTPVAPTPMAKAFGHATPPKSLEPAQKLRGNLATAKGPISVYVQFDGKGAFEATQPAAPQDTARAAPVNATAEVKEIRKDIEATASSVTAQAGATQLYTTTNTLPGAGITADAAKIRELAKRPDVVKITPIVSKHVDNGNSDIDTKALNTWTQTNRTGAGATIAIIDSGIDYTHADFGGPGTETAYDDASVIPDFADVPTNLYDSNKFVGGYDLAGDKYNADPTSKTYSPVPVPDSNPLDCMGHGTHVAGTAAGYGVQANGSTFTGDYSTLTNTDVQAMSIGPGSAPQAKLVALRVFGCEGSSDLVGAALDRVLDPNGDGNFDDRANIVNMSLGSDWTPTDDPENDIVDSLTAAGVLSVVSAGNQGDIYDAGGAPGNAKSSLAVANSVGSLAKVDGFTVTAPAGLAGTYSAQYSAGFAYTGAGVTPATLRGTVVRPPSGSTGCSAFSTADATAIAGKWVFLDWDDNPATNPCTTGTRFNNAQAAGATGVVLSSSLNVFPAGIGGNANIPGLQLTADSIVKLKSAIDAGTLQIQLDPALRGTVDVSSGLPNALNSLSSRGVHGSNGIVKPDVAAPGTNIISANVASGTGSATLSGSSMASAHVAGIAALLAGGTNNPAPALASVTTMTPLQIKTTIMNTAVHDVSDGATVYGPNRVGAGRVDALGAVDAAEAGISAFATADEALTTVNFGVVEAAKPVSVTKKVTVVNDGSSAETFSVGYKAATTMPGVVIGVSPAAVTVPAGSTADVDVTLSIADPTALAKSMDPTMSAVQLQTPRQFLADSSGWLQLSQASTVTLRVPVYAAPKPVSAMSAGKSITFKDGSDSSTVALSGRGVNQGTGAQNYTSLAAPFELGAASPKLPDATIAPLTSRAMDLRYVGASSTIPAILANGGDAADATDNGMIYFGVNTFGNWANVTAASTISVEIDTDGDGTADYVMETNARQGLDLVLVSTYNLHTGAQEDFEYANDSDGGTDTNAFDTDTIVLPVWAAAIGVDPAKPAPFKYRVVTTTEYQELDKATGDPLPVDSTGWISYNPVTPALWFSGDGDGGLFQDLPGTALTAHRTIAPAGKIAKMAPAATTDTGSQALFLHLHNASGAKAEVLNVRVAEAPTATASPSPTLTSTPTSSSTPGASHTPSASQAPSSAAPLVSSDPSSTAGGQVLGETGASGTLPLLLGGAGMIVVAGIVLLMNRRKKASH